MRPFSGLVFMWGSARAPNLFCTQIACRYDFRWTKLVMLGPVWTDLCCKASMDGPESAQTGAPKSQVLSNESYVAKRHIVSVIGPARPSGARLLLLSRFWSPIFGPTGPNISIAIVFNTLCYLRNSASGPEIGLPGRILAGLLP